MTKKEIQYAIESIERHSRELNVYSQVRAKNLRIKTDKGIATADLEILIYGEKQIIKKQIYVLAGLASWVFALTNNA